jgi:hypothetical protein
MLQIVILRESLTVIFLFFYDLVIILYRLLFLYLNEMKKLYFLCLCLLVALATKAVEAFPYPEQAKQPDGTTLTIQAHGDEWFNYVTTADGYTVVKNDKGYFVICPTCERCHHRNVAHCTRSKSALKR